MPNEFANMIINRVVIHQIFKREDTRDIVEPRYNNELTQLDAEGIQTLQNRITLALGSDSYNVEMSVVNTNRGSVFESITQMISAVDEVFIQKSKELALRLTESQANRRIPGGVVVVFSGRVGPASHKYVGIIKAEIHNGFSIQDDNSRLVLNFLSDLLLTPQQRLYKIGFFVKISPDNGQDSTPTDYRVFVYDHNLRTGNLNDVATYFYSTFLGCTFTSNGKKLTQDFYTNSKNFVDSLELDDEQKLDLNYALYSYLKLDNSPTISTADFAERFFEIDVRDRYQNFMETKGFPSFSVSKDLTFLEKILTKRRIKFSSDVRIECPSSNFTDLIEYIGYENGRTTLSISGRIQEQK